MSIAKLKSNPYTYTQSLSTNKLVDLLRKLSKAYYTGEAIVSDEIYDIAEKTLKDKDPDNPYLAEVGYKITKDKVKMPFYMNSLEKIKNDQDKIQKWTDKYKGPYVVSDKLDGVSCLLHWKDKKVKLYSRGNEEGGKDISHFVDYLFKNFPNDTAVRGELIISRSNFKKLEGTYKNIRGAAAGMINSGKIIPNIFKYLDFITYAVINPRYSQDEQMKLLEKYKFNVVKYQVVDEISLDELTELLINRRKTSKYDVDGIVIIDSSTVYKIPHQKYPPYGFAFKMLLTEQTVETEIVNVEWNLSKDGYLKPKIQVKPVIIGTVKIEYATAKNAKYVVKHKIGIGALIKLSRSGDVIPDIVEVIKPANEISMPSTPYKWNDTKVDLIATDLHEEQQQEINAKQMAHFLDIIGVKGASETTMLKLIKNGYTNIYDLLKMNITSASEIEGLGEKSLKKLKDDLISKLSTIELHRIMAGSGIFGRGLGVDKIKLITYEYPNIMKSKWNEDVIYSKVLDIKGFDEKTAKQYAYRFDKFRKFYKKLAKIIIFKKQIAKGNKFKNQIIVMTGFRNAEWKKLIENNDGKVTNSVSKNTTLVVYTDTGSSKYEKAKQLGIKTMTLDDFSTIINKYNNL